MPVFTEGQHAGEVGTITGGDYGDGTVLGRILRGAATSAAKAGGNTGDGAMGAVTAGAAAQVGVYQLRIVAAAANGGTFHVFDPQGDLVGEGSVGVAFAGGGLSFTLADGAADFVVGDGFDITVAAGSKKLTQLDLDATDGSQIAAATLYGSAKAADADVNATIMARDCEVNGLALTWPAGISAAQKTAAIDALAEAGIIVRS